MSTDALGNNIKIGSRYIYTIRKNGLVDVMIGEAVSVSDTGKVTLLPVYQGHSIYGKDIEKTRKPNLLKNGTVKKSSVQSNSITPIGDDIIPAWAK